MPVMQAQSCASCLLAIAQQGEKCHASLTALNELFSCLAG